MNCPHCFFHFCNGKCLAKAKPPHATDDGIKRSNSEKKALHPSAETNKK